MHKLEYEYSRYNQLDKTISEEISIPNLFRQSVEGQKNAIT